MTNLHQILQAIVTGRHQSRSLRFALSGPDAESDRAGTATRGGQGRPQHPDHIDGFRVLGGMIIAYMGFDMLRGGHTVVQAPPENGDTRIQGSLVCHF